MKRVKYVILGCNYSLLPLKQDFFCFLLCIITKNEKSQHGGACGLNRGYLLNEKLKLLIKLSLTY